MYQLTKVVNDEEVFRSRETQNIKEAEHILKVLASRETHIGITDKSGQLVDIERKVVIWSPGDRDVIYRDNDDHAVIMKIRVI